MPIGDNNDYKAILKELHQTHNRHRKNSSAKLYMFNSKGDNL